MTVKMTEMQKSALLEAGNIGSGHAAIALSQLMGRKIMIAIPTIEVIAYADIEKRVSNGNYMLHIVLSIYGDLRGVIAFVLGYDMASRMCDMVMGQEKGSTKSLGEMELSAMKEVGNIISASYVNALSEMTELAMVVSTPESSIGNIDALNEVMAKREMKVGDDNEVFCIRTEFTQMDAKIDGLLLFIPAKESVHKVFAKLGV